MPDLKITQLTEDTGLSLSDLLATVEDPSGTPVTKKATIANLFKILNPPAGFMINGQITTSVTSNNLTVALKTLAGNNPSSTDPVFVRIGNTIRAITSSLSVVSNAGSNWCNAGSAEYATKEIDYFVYLGWDSAAGVVGMGISRIPYARTWADFSLTSTNEKACLVGGWVNTLSTDEHVNVGRINATLSASASYNWSMPSTSIIINRPIFETRWLYLNPTINGSTGSAGTFATDRTNYAYKIQNDSCHLGYNFRITNVGSWSGEFRVALPFTAAIPGTSYWPINGLIAANNTNPATASRGYGVILDGQETQIIFTAGIWNSTLTWASMAANDVVLINGNYPIN